MGAIAKPSPAPAGFSLIAEAAGEEAAVALCLNHGGTRLYVPIKAEGSSLAALIGDAAARKLVDVAAGDQLEVPLSKKYLAGILRARGWSQERVAQKLKIARRTLQRWESAAPPTFPLFDRSE